MKKSIPQINAIQFSDLVNYVRRQIGEYTMPINRETLLEDDLGVTGYEVEELIVNFAKHYHVNIKQFVFVDYFNAEPTGFSFPSGNVKPLTIGHLEKAIISGRLDEEVINNSIC